MTGWIGLLRQHRDSSEEGSRCLRLRALHRDREGRDVSETLPPRGSGCRRPRSTGVWYDRTAQFQARRRCVKPDPLATEHVCEIHLSHVPAMAHLSVVEPLDLAQTKEREGTPAAVLECSGGQR